MTPRLIALNPDAIRRDGASRVEDLMWSGESVFADTAARLGVEYVVFAHQSASPPGDFPAVVVPALRASTGHSLVPSAWPALWRASRCFADDVLWGLDQLGEHRGGIRDYFYLYHGHPAHIPGAIRLGLALRGRAPIVLNMYYLHLCYGSGRPRAIPGLRAFLAATRELRRRANVHLRVDSQRLAESLRKDIGETVRLMPIFSAASRGEGSGGMSSAGRRRVLLPTAQPDGCKGIDLVVRLAEMLGRPDIELVVREPGAGASEVSLPSLAARRGGLNVLGSFFSNADYVELLRSSDVILAPYRRNHFLTRTSSVVVDAFAHGKPVVGPTDCWIGDQIEATGCGHTFVDGDVSDLARAVTEVVDHLEEIRESSELARQRWCDQNSFESVLRAVLASGQTAGGSTVRAAEGGTGLSRMRRDLLAVRLSSVLSLSLPVREAVEGGSVLARRCVSGLTPVSGRVWLSPDDGASSVSSRDPSVPRLPVVHWECRGVEQVELRLDAPDGFLLGRGEARGELRGAYWVAEGQRIYLQDASAGNPASAAHTLDRVRYRFYPFDRVRLVAQQSRARVTAGGVKALVMLRRLGRRLRGHEGAGIRVAPRHVPGEMCGAATIRWSTDAGAVEIRFGGPAGRVLFSGGGTGVESTGPWVEPGMTFCLVDAIHRRLPLGLRVLDQVTVPEHPRYPATTLGRWAYGVWRKRDRAAGWQPAPKHGGTIEAHRHGDDARSMNGSTPSQPAQGRLEVQTTPGQPVPAGLRLRWQVAEGCRVRVHADTVDGRVVADANGSGEVAIGPWVRPFQRFFLLAQSLPEAAGRDRVLDSVEVSWNTAIGRANTLAARRADPSKPTLADRVGPKEWGVTTCSSVSEVLALCSLSPAFLERFGGEKLRVFASMPYLDICRLFPDAPVEGTDLAEVDHQPPLARRQNQRIFHLEYGRIPVGPYLQSNVRAERRTSRLALYLEELGLSVDTPRLPPRIVEELREAVERRFGELGLRPGRTAILTPTANLSPPVPLEAWVEIAGALVRQGFSVATSVPPGHATIPGTTAYPSTFSELVAAAELGGYLLTTGSGISELCSSADVSMHLLRRDCVNAVIPGVELLESLADSNLTDRAVYHRVRIGERARAFAARVASHPDFE